MYEHFISKKCSSRVNKKENKKQEKKKNMQKSKLTAFRLLSVSL